MRFSVYTSSCLLHLTCLIPLPDFNTLLHLCVPFSFSKLVELCLVYLDQSSTPIFRWHIVLCRQDLYVDHGLYVMVNSVRMDVARDVLFADMMNFGDDVFVGHSY